MTKKISYQPIIRLTQAEIDAGAATPLDNVRIINTTNGELLESGAAGVAAQPVGGLKNNFAATIAPTVSNDSIQGYAVGSRWVDTAGQESYICANAAAGAAVWSKTTVGTISEVAGLQTALDNKAASHSGLWTPDSLAAAINLNFEMAALGALSSIANTGSLGSAYSPCIATLREPVW